MTQQPFADAVWKALKGDHNDLRRQAIILEAHREALSQYEKSDTDCDQLREALLALPELSSGMLANFTPSLRDLILAALASKTAIDPVTVERCAQVAETLPTDWRDGTQPGPSSAYRHAAKEIAAAIRALGEQK